MCLALTREFIHCTLIVQFHDPVTVAVPWSAPYLLVPPYDLNRPFFIGTVITLPPTNSV
jgi:hypothetical protein